NHTVPSDILTLSLHDALPILATVLSAQTTDRRVNAVTPELFATYPDAVALAAADRADVERIIRSTGFFRAKTDSLLALISDLVHYHLGDVPGLLDDLFSLPCVGRITESYVFRHSFVI